MGGGVGVVVVAQVSGRGGGACIAVGICAAVQQR